MNKQSNLVYFKMFICLAYIHVLLGKITNLQAQTKKCLFISYDANSKMYYYYDPTTKKIMVTKDCYDVQLL
jgi:hypothetical protein